VVKCFSQGKRGSLRAADLSKKTQDMNAGRLEKKKDTQPRSDVWWITSTQSSHDIHPNTALHQERSNKVLLKYSYCPALRHAIYISKAVRSSTASRTTVRGRDRGHNMFFMI
jgi:hypothetical protein